MDEAETYSANSGSITILSTRQMKGGAWHDHRKCPPPVHPPTRLVLPCVTWHASCALSGAALSAFSLKLELAFRTALAVALSTGLSFFYNWSQTLTWFSIMLSIGGVKKSMVRTRTRSQGAGTGPASHRYSHHAETPHRE